MEFILTDESGLDSRYLPEEAKIDIDIGMDNDIELTVPIMDSRDIHANGYIYSQGTEFGGRIRNPDTNTGDGIITFDGITFRGLLDCRYVLVPSGSDYKVVTGDIDTVIRNLLTNEYNTLFSYVPCGLGLTVTDFKLPRYYSLLDCIERVLLQVGRKLVIEADGHGTKLSVKLKSDEIRDLSETVEYSQDSGFRFRIKKISHNREYVLALGSGTMQTRQVKMYRYNTSTKKLTEVTSFPKNLEVEKFNYPNAESLEDLQERTLEHMKEITETDSQSMTVTDDLNLYLGDIVAGRDYLSGTYIKSAVSDMIIKQSNGNMTISYKVGE